MSEDQRPPDDPEPTRLGDFELLRRPAHVAVRDVQQAIPGLTADCQVQ